MKVIKFAVSPVLIFAVFLFLSFDSQKAWSAEQESYCFTCHTSAKDLISITREIQAKKGAPPKAAGGG
ncbi:MAG: hypothetical protein U9R02_06555 [Thermodesulfobacteriota bacterium]|nr:hypothetical protein [Thermodesulfobacteriota bacterium]